MSELELLSVVALLQDLPERQLRRGQVGTVVESLSPSMVLVEFSDRDGHTYAIEPVQAEALIRLHHSPLIQVA